MSHQHPFHLCVESFHQGCAGGGGVRLIPKNGNQPKEIARLDNVTVNAARLAKILAVATFNMIIWII